MKLFIGSYLGVLLTPHQPPLSQLPPTYSATSTSHLKQTRRERHSSVLKLLKSVVAFRPANEWLWFPAAKLRVRTAPHTRSLGPVGHLSRLPSCHFARFSLWYRYLRLGDPKKDGCSARGISSRRVSAACLDWTFSARSMRDPCSAATNTFVPNPALP